MTSGRRSLVMDGTKLREARLRADLSQRDLAARLDVSQSTVSLWESGRKLPAHHDLLIRAIAHALGVGVDAITTKAAA